jgi:hypothetical protein
VAVDKAVVVEAAQTFPDLAFSGGDGADGASAGVYLDLEPTAVAFPGAVQSGVLPRGERHGFKELANGVRSGQAKLKDNSEYVAVTGLEVKGREGLTLGRIGPAEAFQARGRGG